MSEKQEYNIIISTRPKGKSEDLKDLFEAEGYSFIEFPMIDIRAVQLNEEIKKVFNNMEHYTYLAFTSANAFLFFHDLLVTLNLYKNFSKFNLKIASIGYKTSKVIQDHGFAIDFDAQSKTGEEFSEKLKIHLDHQEAQRILWPTGNLSSDLLTSALLPKHEIQRIDIYENNYPADVDNKITEVINSDRYHMIIVASPSAAINLNRTLTKKNIRIACIGHTTASTASKIGIAPTVIAKEPSAMGIFNAVHSYQPKKDILSDL